MNNEQCWGLSSVPLRIIGRAALSRRASGQRVRGVEIRSFIHADAQAFDQLAAQPAGYEHQQRAPQRKQYRQRAGVGWRGPTHQPARPEQEYDSDVAQAVPYSDPLGPRVPRDPLKIEQSKERRDHPADYAGGYYPKRRLQPCPIARRPTNRVEDHGRGKKSQREHDQDWMNGVSENFHSALHFSFPPENRTYGTYKSYKSHKSYSYCSATYKPIRQSKE